MQNFLDISNNLNVLRDMRATEKQGGEALGNMIGIVNLYAARKKQAEKEKDMKELEYEEKALDLADRYVKRIDSVEDYNKAKPYIEKKFGIDYMPDIRDDKELMYFKDSISNNIKNEKDYRAGKGYKLYKVDKKTGEVMMADVDAISGPELLKSDPEYSRAAPLLAIEKAKAKGQAEGKVSESYSEPYLDDSGNLLQKNLETGKVEKIASPPKGMVIESDGQGGFTMRTGVPTGDMSAKTKGNVEEKIIATKEQYQRVKAISDEFKPEYQEIGARLGAAWTGIKAKLGEGVPKEDAKFLTDFKKYQRKAIENINLYIKEITGAQMSEKEANRLRLAQPDPGEKWYSGDDPITFKAKMDDVLKYARAATARYEYYRSKGFSDKEIKKIVSSDSAISLDELVTKME